MATRRYAEGTETSIEKTRAEIERTLQVHGATAFGYAWSDSAQQAVIGFEIGGRRYQLKIKMPAKCDRSFTHTPTGIERAAANAEKSYTSECRRRWRVRLMMLKALLEAVAESEEMTLHEVLLPWAVLGSGQTVYEWTEGQGTAFGLPGRMPALLPGMEGGR